jgi:uncharacterized protein YpmS
MERVINLVLTAFILAIVYMIFKLIFDLSLWIKEKRELKRKSKAKTICLIDAKSGETLACFIDSNLANQAKERLEKRLNIEVKIS